MISMPGTRDFTFDGFSEIGMNINFKSFALKANLNLELIGVYAITVGIANGFAVKK